MAGEVDGATNGMNGSHSNGTPSYSNMADHFIGGNHLGAAPQGKVKDFVAAHGGHTVITNVSESFQSRELGTRKMLIGGRAGPHRQQWYRSRQGDSIGAEMGIRDVWR